MELALGSNLPHRTALIASANNSHTSVLLHNDLWGVSAGSTLAFLLRAIPPALRALRLAWAVSGEWKKQKRPSVRACARQLVPSGFRYSHGFFIRSPND